MANGTVLSIVLTVAWMVMPPLVGHAGEAAAVPVSEEFVAAAAPAALSGSPEAFVQAISNDVIEVLNDGTLDRSQKKDRLEHELDTCCDFETTSKLVLASNWRRFSAEQRSQFVKLFKRYLIVTYQDNIDAYGGETVAIAGGRAEARDDYTVMTQVKRREATEDILVDYRLRRSASGEWRIIDVIAEGISLVSNLRSQFREVVSRSGPEGLLAALREKTTAVQSDPPAKDDEAPPPDTVGAATDTLIAPQLPALAIVRDKD